MEPSFYNLILRSDKWNGTKSCSPVGNVWSFGECDGQAFMASCSWLCTQSSPWGRCFCGKDFLIFFFYIIYCRKKKMLIQLIAGSWRTKGTSSKSQRVGFLLQIPICKRCTKSHSFIKDVQRFYGGNILVFYSFCSRVI